MTSTPRSSPTAPPGRERFRTSGFPFPGALIAALEWPIDESSITGVGSKLPHKVIRICVESGEFTAGEELELTAAVVG